MTLFNSSFGLKDIVLISNPVTSEKKSHSLRFVIVDVKLFLALKLVHGNYTLLYQEIFFSNVLSEHSLVLGRSE